jgi:hypothetical protein
MELLDSGDFFILCIFCLSLALPLNAILTIIPRSPNTINLFFYP